MRPIDIDASTYPAQLQAKAENMKQLFAGYDVPELEIFSSEPLNYRMRAEFRVWHDGDDLFHIMFDQDTKEKYRVDYFPPASRLINDVMRDLLVLLRPNPVARHKLFQIDYLSSLSNQIVVTLVYHKQLDEAWHEAIGQIRDTLKAKYDIHIIGRARKQKEIIGQDYVLEALPINGRDYIFKQIENSFTQPNAGVNCKMIEWALDVSQACQGDLLELYCGLGNFSLPLASAFDKVLATEISKPSVAAAQFNISANNIDNATILRMSSEEFVEAMQGKRTFKRLADVDLSAFACQTVLVDPPRAGLDDETVSMVKDYENIIYISCNPLTLLENLKVLTQTHRITRFALFDQFPYTTHAECGVFLQKS